MNSIGLIIDREYRQRVAKKSFIITTILMPLLMLGLMVAPALVMFLGGSSESTVLVVDNSGIIGDRLKDSDDTKFQLAAGMSVDSALRRDDVSAVLVIPKGIERAQVKTPLKFYSNGPSSMLTESQIKGQVNDIIAENRARNYDIENLQEILDNLHSDVAMTTVRNDKEAEETASAELSYGLGIMLTFVLYMFLLLYGQMVMTSIIEEKNNRVLEIVVSSVNPTQMMLGKIIGVGLVAVTQILIWGVLTMLMSAFLLPALLPASALADVAAVNAGNLDAVSNDLGLVQAIAALGNVGYIAQIMGTLLVFLIGGFLFYAAIYAAIGSAVDNIQDAGQLQSVTVVPILLGLIFSMTAAADPNSTIAFWLSMIPFTSPMVMMARIPFGIQFWQIAVSAVVLYLSFLVMVFVAAKVYRVGIFMYGKKPNLKELIHWVKYK